MKKWIITSLVMLLIFSCKNGNEKNKKIEGSEKGEKINDEKNNPKQANEDSSINDVRDTNKTVIYKWKEPDKKKFLQDCIQGFEEKADTAKMRDFCSCMLLQAQKYYRDYTQMEEESNDDYERKIFLNCRDKYPVDNDDE